MSAIVWRLFWARIPLPVGPLALALLIGWAWLSIQGWANTREKVAQLVAGEKIAALEATIEARRQIALTAEFRRAKAEAALAALEADAAAAQIERENLNDQISELLSRPVDGDCRVDDALARRLRAN